MDRRRFLQVTALGTVALTGCRRTAAPRGAATSAGPSRPVTATVTAGSGGRRSVRPADWRALERSLHGRLLRPGEAGFERARVLYEPRFDHRVPASVVQAGGTEDVAETTRFARRFGLDLRARSGGHSYVGASTAAGGLQLDLSQLRDTGYDATTRTLRVGAGTALFDVHEALEEHGRTVPTGTCPTVGTAGLTLGGGLGAESSAYGLTCDALREAVVVTADGEVLTVDADRHADLFWALRGGGGGSWGTLTALTFTTFPARRFGFFSLHYRGEAAEAVLRGWQQRIAAMPATSWANVHLDAGADGSLGVRIFGVSLTGDGRDEATAMHDAVDAEPTDVTTYARSHHDGVRLLAGCADTSDADCHLVPHGDRPRVSFVAGSDVLARPLRSGERAAVARTLRARAASGAAGTLILDPLTGSVSSGPGQGAFPWRAATAVAQWYVGQADHPAEVELRAARSWVRAGHGAVAAASAGGYVNYLEPGRPLSDYYGASYPRLRAVRQRYDPEQVFRGDHVIPMP